MATSSPFQNLPVELVHKIFVGAAEEDTLTALSIGSTCTTARKWIADIWTRDVWMDISIDGKAIGTLIMRLYDDVTPKTARNFRELCKGQLKDKTGTKLSYQGCSFHRALRSFLVQAGDIDGKGGQSIYNGPFHDENYTYKFDRRGVIAMANNGPSTNTSQFFITMSRATWLTNHHTIFGEVLAPNGNWEVLEKIQVVDSTPIYDTNNKKASPPGHMHPFLVAGAPKKNIRIDDCGIMPKNYSP